MKTTVDRDEIRYRARRMLDDARNGPMEQRKQPDTHCSGTPDGRVVADGFAR
jgi:hypothetical protein